MIVAVLAAVNFLANRYDKSYDSTANKQFSLSDQTVKVVKGLKHDVTFTTSTTPRASRRRATCWTATPTFPEAARRLHRPGEEAAAGASRRLPARCPDPGGQRQQKEEAKSLTEEEVTGALIRSLKTGERNACFVTRQRRARHRRHGRTGYSAVKEALERNNYKTRSLNLLGPARSPPRPALRREPRRPPARSKCPRTARCWSWRARSTNTCSRKWTPSRRT